MTCNQFIAEIKNTIVFLKKLNGKRTLWKARRIRKILKLRKTQLALLLDLLELEDSEFSQLWNRNMDLLKGENLQFNVTRNDSHIVSGHPTKLSGQIDKHGKINAKPAGGAFPFMGKRTFPKVYAGKIDGIGQFFLRSESNGMSLFGRVLPKNYMGSIQSNGAIEMRISQKKNEMWQFSNIGQLVCNPFGNDTDRRNEFLNNKDLMMRKAALRLAFIEKELSN
ncbi:MAG: hypothetical protein GQ574_18425 [Crocinitomix sp.]|nr:hypothetical protein [Crocinitomix sp.]